MTDYAPAIPMYVPSDNVFIDQIIPKWVVIHKTASAGSIQTFVNCRLGWTATLGVYTVPPGAELLFLENR